MRKDIKKSSYYVWFLGAQEAKGLRGVEYVLPVVRSLVEREREVEPFKVTLQVSHKGLKIVQNVPGSVPPAPPLKQAAAKPAAKAAKAETVKHFIPHHAVTCVLQQEDIVSCILLLYNPVTKCPVHVHAYRCDSVETAQILCGQLQTLIERPDNQKKLAEIEARLRAKGLLPTPGQGRPGHDGHPQALGQPASRRHASAGSDGRSTSTRESESSGGSGGSSSERLSALGTALGAVREERISNLYDSLAAELREKLATDVKAGHAGHAPILLPPRDYDTVHRQKGNLASVDRRRCLNASIVGVNAKNVKNLGDEESSAPSNPAAAGKRGSGGSGGSAGLPGGQGGVAQTGRGGALLGSSGGSSGIGSDHAPSPDNESDPRYLDNASSSDEEWNEEPSEDSLFLVQPGRGALSGWRVAQGLAQGTQELSLPRARRVHSPAASPSPTSPNAHGSLGRDHPLAVPGPRRRHASPTSLPVDNDGYSRHLSREDDDDVPHRMRARRAPADERQRTRSPRSPRTARSARSPPRSASPLAHHHHQQRNGTSNGTSSASPPGPPALGRSSPIPRPHRGQGVSGSSSLSGPMSPRERFQDAKEKFLSLERERLEEQERVMQLNLEKRRANQQQQQHAPPSPHSPPVVEPPISPAVVAGPRPRPRPRRPSWSRSRDDSDDDVLDTRYFGDEPLHPADQDDDGDDDDFSGNVPPTGGRQRIIAAVNRRMSRESLDDNDDPPARPVPRSGPSGPPGPPGASRGARPSAYPARPAGRPSDHSSRGREPRPAEQRVVSRSRSVHREDRFRSPARGETRGETRGEARGEARGYPSSPERCAPRVAPRAMYPAEPMMDDTPPQPPRYRIPYSDDHDIPLERYRSSNNPRPGPRHPAYPRDHRDLRDHEDDLSDPRDPRAYLADKKRRSMFEAMEEERRRHSNELAQEFKRRSYQELDERERYPGLDRDTARDAAPPGPPRGQVSARYRHSYAEPPPRHHDLLHRANSAACAASPRVGIAAVHPY